MKLLPLLSFFASGLFACGAAMATEAAGCHWPEHMPAASVLLVGEIHGTEQAPALVAALACAALKTGKPVTVALEVPVEEQANLDRFLVSDGSENSRAVLLSGPFWNRATQDGRSSAAMLALLHRLRALRARGANLRVVAVDDGAARTRDVGMAERIRAQRHRGTVIALLGNVHASQGKGRRSRPDYEPAGYLLRDLDPFSLYVGGPAGTAWVCAPECGVRAVSASRFAAYRPGYSPAEGAIPGYIGFYAATGTTASPPAIR